MAACYNGPIPVDDKDRMAIWSWAKTNAIDHGLPYEKVGQMINDHFFGGTAKEGWIDDILSGRKTPYRELSNAAWKAQYNRRMITQQAQAITQNRQLTPIGKLAVRGLTMPRALSVMWHWATPPLSHAGDLIMTPTRWGTYFKGLINTWGKALSPAETERLVDSMRRHPLYDLALRSGLATQRTDIKGILDPTRKGSANERAFEILGVTRFNLWAKAMEQSKVTATTPQDVALDYGKNFADWANAATGAGKGGITRIPGVSQAVFGPSLTQSKLQRMFVDPLKTIWTGAKVSGVAKIFGNWDAATPGEKAVALRRLSGAGQFVGTGVAFLMANQAYLSATGQKDKINFFDPNKSDWMMFKSNGMEFGFPGLHTELRALGQILNVAFMDSKAANKFSHGEGKQALVNKIGADYVSGKLNPTIDVAKEFLTGQDWMGRSMPWTGEKGTAKKPAYSWGDYAISHGPIPLQGPIKYLYDTWRKQGMSALDATHVIKGLIMAGSGFVGVHAKPEPEDTKKSWVAQALQNR